MHGLTSDTFITIQFVYGAAFVVMGLTIALESAMTSRFVLVRGIWLLAVFGILHGLAEWYELVIALESQYRPFDTLQFFTVSRLLLMSASFACLLQFGTSSLLPQSGWGASRGLRLALSLLFWSFVVVLLLSVRNPWTTDGYIMADIMSRYALGFTGSLAVSYALSRFGRYFREAGRNGIGAGLYWASFGFALYAFAEGIIVPEGAFWPASVLNEASFESTFGISIEAVRGALAVFVAVSLTKAFVVENRRALESASQILTTLNESMKAITSSLNIDAVLKLIIQQAAKAVEARGGVLLLLESEDQELIEKARYGNWQSGVLDSSHPICQYLFGKARDSGATVVLDDRKKGQDLPPNIETGRLAYLCAPIKMTEKALGAILLVRERGDLPFSGEDVQLVSALAGEAAIAIENARLYSHTWEMTITDALTGLRNYRYLEDRLRGEVARAARYQRPFSVIAADCDCLKEVNDRYGHYHGDRLLRGIAGILVGCVRASDVVTRRAGDEFIILMPETASASALRIAERIRRAVEKYTIDVDGDRIGATMSFGVATFPDHAGEAEELLRKADQATYKAKATGKNSISIWTEEE